MSKQTKTFSRVSEFNEKFEAEAYTEDGRVWRWVSNDAPVPLDAAERYGVPVDRDAQEAAQTRYYEEVIQRYRENQTGAIVSDERRAELRAAFGPGQVVVDVFTGRRTRT